MEAGPSIETSLVRSPIKCDTASGQPMKNGSSMLEIRLKAFDSFPRKNDRWNANEDLASMLVSAQKHPEWVAENTLSRPPSGTQVFYRRKDGAFHFKQDGYIWKTRKDGKMPREDHMKLKVKGIELLSANYVHSALVPTFHRRAYSLLSSPDLVFVHYLNVPFPQNSVDSPSESPLEERLLTTLRSFAHLSRLDLLDQLLPMLRDAHVNPRSQIPVTPAWIESIVDNVKLKHSMLQQKLQQGPGPEPKALPISAFTKEKDVNEHGSSVFLFLPPGTAFDTYDGQFTTSTFLAPTDYVSQNNATTLVPAVDGIQAPLVSSAKSKARQDSAETATIRPPILRPPSVAPQVHSPIGRSSSCSSTSKSGLSSIRIRREPSTISEPNADEVFNVSHSLYIGRAGSRPDDSAYNSFAESADYYDNKRQELQTPASAADPILPGLVNDASTENHFQYAEGEFLNRVSPFSQLLESLIATEGKEPTESHLNQEEYSMGDLPPPVSEEPEKSHTNETSSQFNTAVGQSGSFEQSCAYDTAPLSIYLPAAPTTSNHDVVAHISDYSPEWSFTEGHVKILVSGPWYLSGHAYACSFGEKIVPAFLVQNGVLRTYCPPHGPGCVPLRVLCDDAVISNQVAFEYREHQSRTEFQGPVPVSYNQEHETDTKRFVLGLLDRLEHLETFLNRSSRPTTEALIQNEARAFPETAQDLEQRFVLVCERMSRYEWKAESVVADDRSMKLLHFSAALGFSRLIATLLRWRAEKPSPFLVNEVSPLMRDDQGRTPLFWACIRGNLQSAKLLLQYNRAAVWIADNQDREPLVAATMCGFGDITDALRAGFEKSRDPSRCSDRRDSIVNIDPCADATAYWVLSDGESISKRDVGESRNCLARRSSFHNGSFRRAKKPLMEDSSLLRIGRRASFARERTKRTSVEGVEALLLEQATHSSDDFGTSSSTTEAKISRQEDCDPWLEEPLSVEIPMDVEPPDSPDMEQMFEQATTPNLIMDDGTRVQIFNLAQQIIDALPARIKQENFPELGLDEDTKMDTPDNWSSATVGSRSRDQSPISSLPPADFLTYRVGTPSDVASPASSSGLLHSPMARSTPLLSSASTNEEAAGLGAFFNANRFRKSPLERHFQELTLSDREQRELYGAARVIQNAFRQYKSRITSQRQLDVERRAAVVIQSYYRRYRQFCYFKKLHRAAVLIQKHFRLYKLGKQAGGSGKDVKGFRRGNRSLKSHRTNKSPGNFEQQSASAEEEQFWEDMIDAQLRYDNTSASSLELAAWKRHLAAIRIQHAYRGHYMRKRQAAAIKIQKFMRESRQNGLDVLTPKATSFGWVRSWKKRRNCSDGGGSVDLVAWLSNYGRRT